MKKQITAFAAFLLFSYVSFAQEKLIPVHRDVKYGYAYSEDGPLILPARYDDALYFEEGMAPVKIGDKWGYINEQGVLVIAMKFDYANLFTDGYALVGKASATSADGHYLYGLINKAGVLVLPMKYDGLGDLEEGLISDQIGDKMGFINLQGVQVIPLKFDAKLGNSADFANGFAKITVGKKFEFIDKKGKIICPPKYTQAADFKEGMAMVGIDTIWNKHTSDGSTETNAWGFIDATGKEVLPCKYEQVANFENGFGQAQLDGYIYKIDKTGKIVDTISKPRRRPAMLCDSVTYSGKINKTGRITIEFNTSNTFMKSITVNGIAISNIYQNPINVDLRQLKLKAGSNATIKIIYGKGGEAWIPSGQGFNKE